MPKLIGRDPKHGKHASGRGVVYLSGAPHYTGKYGTPEAHTRYLELLAQWNGGGRVPLRRAREEAVSVRALLDRYRRDVLPRYVKRGEATSHVRNYGLAMAQFEALFGSQDAARLTIDDYETYQGALMRRRNRQTGRALARNTINIWCSYVRKIFRWGAKRDLIPRLAWADTRDAEPVRRGQGAAEPRKVRSAPEASVAAVLETLPRNPRDLVRLMRCSGMRPGEAVAIRACDLDTSGEVWVYRVDPDVNKTEHHGQDRVVYLGPRAREILEPRLELSRSLRAPTRPLFPGYKQKHYGAPALAALVRRHCGRLGVEPFTPNQLRHSRLTEVRRTHGLEGSAVIGGHDVETTKIYAEQDEALARKIARDSG